MPIKIPNGLPGRAVLERESIPLILEDRAARQDIRPLQVAILNLMPDKIKTETQLLRGLGASPLQIEVTLLCMDSHDSKNTPKEHLTSFYQTLADVKARKFDALIVTGAPLGRVAYQDVTYWPELQRVFDWARTNVFSSFFICWGALAGLYHYYGVEKKMLAEKRAGVFAHRVLNPYAPITQGFDDSFFAPVSRYTMIDRGDVEQAGLSVMVELKDGEPCIVQDEKNRRVFVFSHMEYDAETLKLEYERDVAAGLNPQLPENYFPKDNPSDVPAIRWRAHRTLMFTNWINAVYQDTPYNLEDIGQG